MACMIWAQPTVTARAEGVTLEQQKGMSKAAAEQRFSEFIGGGVPRTIAGGTGAAG